METIVLITGANQGIGYEIAKKLSSNEFLGYHVLLGSRDISKGETAATEISKAGGNIEAIQLDVTDQSSIAAAKEYVQKTYGHLDVLINNAATMVDTSVSPTYPLGQAMQDTFATNTIGAANVTEAFIPLLQKAELRVPRLVFVSSTAGSVQAMADFQPTYTRMKYFAPAYACSKAALNMLMLHYKVSLGENFKVNACCPGFRKTNFCGFDDKAGDAADGATVAVELATLGRDGPTGTFAKLGGPVPW